MDRDGHRRSVNHEFPVRWRHQAVERHAIVVAKLLGTFRRALCGKIIWAAADDLPDRSDACRDEAAVRQHADPYCNVDSVFVQVHDAVSKHNSDVDIGIGLEELGGDRQHVQAPEYNRRREDKIATGHDIFAGGGLFDLLKILENSLAAGDVGAAGVG